jgi:hypothetical protein
MTKSVETEAPPVPSKEEILEKVTEIFFETIPWMERHEVSTDADINKLKIYHDDISYFLVMALRHFDIPSMVPFGDCPPTIQGISDFIYDYLSSGRQWEDPRDKQGLWGKFQKWIAL